MRVARRHAMRLMTVRLMVPSCVDMTGMSVGADRRELNGNQQDCRSDRPPNCSGRGHGQLLLYDPGQGNKRTKQRIKSR